MLNKITFLGLLLCAVIPLSASAAVYEVPGDEWSITFHLEYKDGTLGVDTSAQDVYLPLPFKFEPEFDPAITDYYGVTISGKGKELGRFGFNKPSSVIPTLGKSLFEARGRYFANADHVSFYAKSKKHLFDISVKGSSFCDDNYICNAAVGEDYLNCPNDCPPPPVIPPDSAEIPSDTPAPDVVSPTPSVGTPSESQPSPTPETQRFPFSKTQIALTVLGIIFFVLTFILWKLRRFSEG